MKKLFLIPLMAMLCTVMAFATVRTAGTFDELQNALTAAVDGDEIQLTADITYPTNGTGLVNITKSITLDGQGHTLYGYGTANIAASGAADNYPTALAVNASVFDAVNAPTLNVTLKNLTLGNIKNEYWPNETQKSMVNDAARFYGLTVYDGVESLIMDNVNILVGRKNNNNNENSQPGGWHQMFCITGINSTPLDLTVTNSHIYAGESKYPMYVLKPIDATLENSIFEGYCALYFKYRASGVYGNVVGSRGSIINADACAFNAPNVHDGRSNSFAIFPLEDDGITFNLNNCSYNAQQIGNQYQMFISLQYLTRENGFQPVVFNLSGDNTHVYNVNLSAFATTGWHSNDDEHLNTYVPEVNIPFALNISGGTYSVNPEDITFHTYVDGTTFGIGHSTLASGYEVQTVKQGTATLYRVVKASTGTAINDNAGQNEDKTVEVATGTAVTLEQETTETGYLEVKDNGSSQATTVTIAKNDTDPTHSQTLVVNNGLDVQGNSSVVVEPTAALVIGEGGITTEKAENIVLNADEDGGASLLLHPDITVNQTPELTVMMKAEQVGIYETEFYWHRFAMPVASISALPHTPNTATAIYGWDYNAQDWYALSGLNQLVPFAGYALTVNGDRQDVTYTFQGNLTGNINTDLAFSHQGYNFFGNSYTGYIKVSYLANEIIGNADIDASIWMWNPATQSYAAVGLQALKDAEDGGYATAMYPNWQREIAPMQTFILRLPNTTSATAEVDYAATIWANPRYAGSATPAPARANAEIEGTIVRLSVADANGNSDEMLFMEKDSYSDAYDRGYDATKYMNSNNMNMYTLQNGEKLSAVATDNLNGKSFDIETKGAISYTLIFDAVLGETNYAVRDNVTGATIAMNQGSTYTFTAQPNSTVAGRFTFVPVQNMPTDVETVEANSNVRGIYTITGQYVGEDFESLPAGVYVVDGVKIVK